MITSLRLVNFKNFADETLRLGPFTLIVGANASGKSNIRDAFRFLHGIGRGYTLAEIIGGKFGAGGQVEWEPIRGAPNEVIRFGNHHQSKRRDFSVYLEFGEGKDKSFYCIQVGFSPRHPDGFRVLEEQMSTDSVLIFAPIEGPRSSDSMHFFEEYGEGPIEFRRALPALTQFCRLSYGQEMLPRQAELELHFALESMNFFDFSPDQVREPSIAGAAQLGDSGQNLPSVLKAICAEPTRKNVLAAWLRELTPMDVADFKFPRDPSGRIHLQIQEANGKKVSAYSASDGTLRFLGMLAALLNEDYEGLYFFEEIDNGIHPARLHLLLDLIERQTAKGKIQVVATTHSPDVLNLINDTTFENAVVVYRDEDVADAVIRRVAELPNARELRESQGLGRLHASGWMENILSFAEADGEGQKDGE